MTKHRRSSNWTGCQMQGDSLARSQLPYCLHKLRAAMFTVGRTVCAHMVYCFSSLIRLLCAAMFQSTLVGSKQSNSKTFTSSGNAMNQRYASSMNTLFGVRVYSNMKKCSFASGRQDIDRSILIKQNIYNNIALCHKLFIYSNCFIVFDGSLLHI